MNIKGQKWFLIGLLILITGLIYYPGLKGGFIFDDLNSLSKLKIIDNNLSSENIINYIGQSDTGPLKRPISMLSFLIDGQTWPTSAYSFKQTNLIIHLFNGLLLFGLLNTLFSRSEKFRSQSLSISLISTAFWLLHPFLVSTTFYIVQRMAMLPAMFSLLGMWIYILGRINWHDGMVKKAKWQLLTSVFICVPLAVLSKENGALLIFHIALLEVLICRYWLSLKPLSSLFQWLVIRLPVIALMIALLVQIPGFLNSYEIREFSLSERILSQFRALSKYIYHLVIPSYFTEGVFTDGFKYSKSLFSPISTLWSLLFITSLAVTAYLCRKKFIWLTFALCFFGIAHLLESTIVPLELYFEHRNYLASVFLFVPMVLLLLKACQKIKVYYLISFILISFFGFQLALRVNIWSDNYQMHYLTMEKFPESIRARTMTAVYLENFDREEDALKIITDGIALHQNLELRFNQLALKCSLKKLKMSDVNLLVQDIEKFEFTKFDVRPLGGLMAKLLIGDCLKAESMKASVTILEAIKKKNKFTDGFGKALVLYLEGSIRLEQEQYDLAFNKIVESFRTSKDDYYSLNNSIIKFLTKGQVDHAEKLQRIAEEQYQLDFKYKPDWLNHGVNIKNTRVVINQLRKQEENAKK